jgi:hypothetical protein
LRDHLPGGRPRREELRAGRRGNRAQEVVHGHLDERCALHVVHADQVDGHVDPAGPGDDVGGVRVDRRLVECVDDGGVDRAAVSAEGLGGTVECGLRAPGQEHVGARTGERGRHRPADRPATSVDYRGLAVEEHRHALRRHHARVRSRSSRTA